MYIYKVETKDNFFLSSTTKGNQIKWFDDNKWIKADSMGYESISEFLVTMLEKYIADFDYVPYYLCRIEESDNEKVTLYDGCFSEHFLESDEYIVPIYRILEQYFSVQGGISRLNKYVGKELVYKITDICSEVTGISKEKIMRYFSDIIKLDAIILNEDRHLNNISFIKNLNGSYRLSPVFDNGLALLSDTKTFQLYENPTVLMRRVKSRPFSSSFKKQTGYFADYPKLKIDFNGFREELSGYNPEFKEKEYMRARLVLLRRLNELKGVTWDEV